MDKVHGKLDIKNNNWRKKMATEILAPMAGKIVRIDIETGASLFEDQEILFIEAMKMETPIYAPCDGVIDKIFKKVGDDVEEDDLIAIMA
jgi:biotin carboxyl carrier protein